MTAAKPEIWQNSNGTWSHKYDAQREWADKGGCLADLRFSKEWLAGKVNA